MVDVSVIDGPRSTAREGSAEMPAARWGTQREEA